MLPLALLIALGALPKVDTATTCAEQLDKSLAALERIPPRRRAPQVLGLLANDCRLLPEGLRLAAKRSAGLKATARASILGQAALELLPKRCPLAKSEAPATALAEACPLPEPILPTERELATLDQGTYAFGLVVMESLARIGVRRDVRTAIFVNLMLATNLERHKSRSVAQ